MELSGYLRVFRKRWLSATLVALCVVASTALSTLFSTPEFTASTRMFFSVQGGGSIADLNQGSTFAENQLGSYAEVARSPLVLAPVAEELDLGRDVAELTRSVSVEVLASTLILKISATDREPQIAADLANAVADQLTVAVSELSPEQSNGLETVVATVLARADVPASPTSPNVPRNLALGLVVGVVMGIGVALLREALDTKVRGAVDVEAVTSHTIIGTVALEQDKTNAVIFVRDSPNGSRAESIRRLRTNLQYIDPTDSPKSIVVTSSVSGEGKTTTAINLAVSLADSGARVILVDADLRRPSVAEYLAIEGRVGLTTVLIGRAELEDVAQPWTSSSLDILPAGQVPPNPSELLGSRAMSALIEQLVAQYDVVILDSPPLLPVTDAAVLSRIAGGSLLVAGADRIHKNQLKDAIEALHKVDARVLGVVLNKVEASRGADHYYYGSYTTSPSLGAAPPGKLGRSPSTWPGKPIKLGE